MLQTRFGYLMAGNELRNFLLLSSRRIQRDVGSPLAKLGPYDSAHRGEKLPYFSRSSPRILPALECNAYRSFALYREARVGSTASFDLVVIGCGPAGEKAGAQAAYFGKRVALIERAQHMGGSCINTGTVPCKTLRESALYFSGLKQRGLYGIDYSLKENLTVQDFMHHERAVVEMERRRILKNLELHRIELIRGQATFEDPHTLRVNGPDGTRRLRGDVILIATGSKPNRPAEIAFDDVHTFDSDSFLHMDRIPKSLAVIGGGVIGCEYASIFMALGVDVALVDGRDRLLPFLDAEIANRLRDRFLALGMHLWFKERPAKVENHAAGARLSMKSGKTLEVDAALFAAGRRAAVDGLALEKACLSL